MKCSVNVMSSIMRSSYVASRQQPVTTGKKMPHHKYGAHGCVLRRDFDEMKKHLAEVKVTQHEMMNEMREGMQRITIAIEKLEKSSRNVANVVNSMNSDILVIGGMDLETDKVLSSVERFNILNQIWPS